MVFLKNFEFLSWKLQFPVQEWEHGYLCYRTTSSARLCRRAQAAVKT
jgi:hypothetical protein